MVDEISQHTIPAELGSECHAKGKTTITKEKRHKLSLVCVLLFHIERQSALQ